MGAGAGADTGATAALPAAGTRGHARKRTQSADAVHKGAETSEAAPPQQAEPTEYMRNRPRCGLLRRMHPCMLAMRIVELQLTNDGQISEQSGSTAPCTMQSATCRRELAGLRTSMGATTESLELIRPQDFMGPPGARTPMAQPFHVLVHPQVSGSVMHAAAAGASVCAWAETPTTSCCSPGLLPHVGASCCGQCDASCARQLLAES